MKNKVLSAGKITELMLKSRNEARHELYEIILKTIKKFKKSKKTYLDMCDDDVNNVLATLIKDSTDKY